MILILLILLILIIALIITNIILTTDVLQKYKSPILVGGKKKYKSPILVDGKKKYKSPILVDGKKKYKSPILVDEKKVKYANNRYNINNSYIANTIHKQYTYRLFLFKDKNEKNQNYDRHHFEYLIDALNKLGWKETDKQYADFAFSLSFKILYDRKFKSDLKYGFNGIDILYHKNSLFKRFQESLKNAHPKHLPYTEDIEHFIWKDGNIIIVKEVFSYGQAGVYVIIDEKSFIILKDKLLSEHKKAICSTYITNPLLCKGKKFHLRILIAPFLQRGKSPKITYMKTMITLKMAKSEYIIKSKEDYLDPNINISGGATNDELIIWDVDQCNNLSGESNKSISSAEFFKKCNKSIHDAIYSIPLDSLSLFHNQNAGYFIYGADIMLDDTGYAWILELNKRPQHIGKIISKYPKEFEIAYTRKYFSELFQWLLDDIILPYFKYI